MSSDRLWRAGRGAMALWCACVIACTSAGGPRSSSASDTLSRLDVLEASCFASTPKSRVAADCAAAADVYLQHSDAPEGWFSSAAALYERACAKGHAPSCRRIGRAYLAGWPIGKTEFPADRGRAAAAFWAACTLGDAESCRSACTSERLDHASCVSAVMAHERGLNDAEHLCARSDARCSE